MDATCIQDMEYGWPECPNLNLYYLGTYPASWVDDLFDITSDI